MRKLAIYTVIACAAFLAAFVARTRAASKAEATIPSLSVDAPDSTYLSALGIRPGRQLVVYLFGGSRCGFCQKRETKDAFSNVRQRLMERYVTPGPYSSLTIIGVALDADLTEGVKYLRSFGSGAVDQVSVGSGWQNDHIIRLLQRDRIATPAVPLIIVISRSMAATLAPLTIEYGADSVISIVQGSDGISEWVRNDAPLGIAESPKNDLNLAQ